MYNKVFPNPVDIKNSSGLLGSHIDCFVIWMQRNGYSRDTIRYKVRRIIYFGQYLHKRGISSMHQLEGMGGKKLLADYRRYCKRHGFGYKARGLRSYIQALKDAGVIANLASWDSLLLPLTRQYVTFVRNQNNLAKNTVQLYRYWIERFLRFLGCKNSMPSMPTFGIADVDRFIEQEAIRLKHAPHRSVVHALRSFLGFLYRSGKIFTDFSYLIITPRHYKLQFLPTVLTWPEVQKVLNSVDQSSKIGLQHYAILLLLTTYGLRAGEVAQVKLEDIDWRKETVHIVQRKMGRDLWLPLTPQVGKAILKYLKHARPSSRHREIFLHLCAPWTPLNQVNITYVVNRYIQLVGLDPPHGGAHLLRHSFATHLIRQGVPLKQIGDMLGHRNLESTHIYTKTAIERLQEVALEIPEVK